MPSLKVTKYKPTEKIGLSGETNRYNKNLQANIVSAVHFKMPNERKNERKHGIRKNFHKPSFLIKSPKNSLNIQHKGGPKKIHDSNQDQG